MPAEREVIVRIGAELSDLEEKTLRSQRMLRQWTNEVKRGSMSLELYGRAAAESIKKGFDPTGMQVGIKQATVAWAGFFQQLKANLGILSQTAQNMGIVSTAGERVVNTLGRTRLAYAPMSLLTTEVANLAGSMGGLEGSTALVRTGMYAATSAVSSFLPIVGTAAIAITGLIAMFLLKRKRIEENTKSIYDNIAALTKLAGVGDERARRLALEELKKAEKELETAKSKAYHEALNQNKSINEAIDYSIKQTVEQQNKVNDLRKAYEELGKKEKEIALDVLKNKLKWEAEHNTWALEAYKGYLQNRLREQTKWSDEYVSILKEIEGIEKKIHERNFEYNKSYVYKSAESLKDFSHYVFKAGDAQLEFKQKTYDTDLANYAKHTQAVMRYVDSLSQGFANAFAGIETDWGKMLQNMVAQFAQVALSSLVMSLLFPEISFMKFFQAGMGFQHGTPFVPKTGFYMLHRGEAVTPASRNISYVRNYSTGGATNNYYLINLDVDRLTRNQIVPMIENMAKNRKTRILTA